VRAFSDAGVDLLLLQCSPQLEEMERFAEQVMPRLARDFPDAAEPVPQQVAFPDEQLAAA
jgi:hypothetical protein